jgi:tetratricopeptide (TPR) repeat protein
MDSTLQAAEYLMANLRDSLRIAQFEIDNVHGQVAMLEQERVVLSDSVRAMQLRIQMMKSNVNYTMRHLSSSLQHFYQGNYRDALQEVEMAIQLNPDLAIAYARRGSIYFKLGDIQRATINWNLALKLDPEYDDVRNILRALKENRLKTTSVTQQQ